MAKVRKVSDDELSLQCECGLIHIVKLDESGSLSVETMEVKKGKVESEPPVEEKKRSIFSLPKKAANA